MKAVFAFDSFKGSASSGKLGEAALRAFLEILPHAETMCYQIADGGEGCLEALLSSPRGATAVQCKTHDPLMRRIVSSYATMPDGTAMIEAASASGLTLITESERNPMKTSSFGTGEQIADAIRSGCREIYLMLGGTATNDAGTGILSALGFIFRDADGNAVEPAGENLARIRHIDSSGTLSGLDKCRFALGCDVNTLFYGENGAAYVFAAQKGASQNRGTKRNRHYDGHNGTSQRHCRGRHRVHRGRQDRQADAHGQGRKRNMPGGGHRNKGYRPMRKLFHDRERTGRIRQARLHGGLSHTAPPHDLGRSHENRKRACKRGPNRERNRQDLQNRPAFRHAPLIFVPELRRGKSCHFFEKLGKGRLSFEIQHSRNLAY